MSALRILQPVDLDSLMRALTKPGAPKENRPPRILHVDDDHIVAQALGGVADVVSVNSLDEARRASTAGDFDLAVLDIALAAPCNINSAPDIRDSSGNAIPLVAFYAQKSESAYDGPADIALTTSHASIEGLMVAVKEHLVSRLPIVPEQLK